MFVTHHQSFNTIISNKQQKEKQQQQQQKETLQQQDLQKNIKKQFQTVLIETHFEEQYQQDPTTNVSTSNGMKCLNNLENIPFLNINLFAVYMTGSHLQYVPRSRCNSLDGE